MTDASNTENGRKPFGRKQLIAIYGFATPLAAVFLQSCGMLIAAVAKGGDGWQVAAAAAIDKFTGFATSYVPTAMAVILGIAGVVQVGNAVSSAIAAKKPTP